MSHKWYQRMSYVSYGNICTESLRKLQNDYLSLNEISCTYLCCQLTVRHNNKTIYNWYCLREKYFSKIRITFNFFPIIAIQWSRSISQIWKPPPTFTILKEKHLSSKLLRNPPTEIENIKLGKCWVKIQPGHVITGVEMFVMFCDLGCSPVRSIIIRKCGYIVRLSIIYSYKNRAEVPSSWVWSDDNHLQLPSETPVLLCQHSRQSFMSSQDW